MNNRMLAVLGALAAVGVIVLYVFVKNAGSAPAADPDPEPVARPTATSHDPSTANGGTSVGPAQPALPAGTGSGSGDVGSDGSGQYPKDYMIGDIRVRDHRTGNNKPLDLPTNIHPAEHRELPSTLTHDISQQVKKLVWQCGAEVPKDARGTKPRVDGQLTVSIKNHTLLLTNIVTQPRDIEGPSADALKQCVEQKSAGLTAVASDQEDITDYGIGITFAIP